MLTHSFHNCGCPAVPKPNLEFVKSVLTKNNRGIELRDAIQYAWDSRLDHPRAGRWRRKTTRAHVVWEDTVDKAVETVAIKPGVMAHPHNDTVSFIFDDCVLVRCKKADLMLRSKNVRTGLSDLFDDHSADLFGYTGLQRVEAVYVLDPLETEIIWSGIVARENGEVIWKLAFEDMIEAPVVVPFPQQQVKEAAAPLVRIREGSSRDGEDKKKGEGKGPVE